MKKVLALLLSCGMLLALLAGCGQSTTPPPAATDGKEVTIGVFEPLTGDSGAGGKQEVLGMEYANQLTPTIDIGGETYNIKLVSADNGSTTDKAPTAAQQLVSAQAAVILGSYGSAVSIAGSPIFATAGIPAIGVTCTNPQVTEGNDHYFRICFLDPFQGTVLSSFAIEKFEAKKAYCLAELGNDYDVGLTNYFKEAFEGVNGEGSVISENFPNGNADFSSYLNTAKAQGVDVIFAPTSISYATLIIEQAASLGIDIALLAGDTWDNNKVVEAAQGTNIQLYISTFYQEGGSVEFDDGFKAFLNADPEKLTNNGGNDMISATSAMGYDAYYVALEAMKLADSVDPAAILAALSTVDYAGVTGKIVFDDNGDAVRDTAYIKAVDTANNTWIFEKEQGI